jgi:hypothetical protein
MSGLFKKSLAAALFLGLGSAINHANGATLGGWQITTSANAAVSGISVTGGNTLLIATAPVTFSDGNPQNISFTQVSADAVPFIEVASQIITNLSGSNWTGFQFALSGGTSSFDGISNVFAPPLSPGVNYTTVTLNPARTLLAYSGSQLDGGSALWGSSNPGDDLLIDGNPTVGTPFTSFSLDESPQGSIGPIVPAPAAAWQCLATLLALGFIPTVRKAVRVLA